MNASSMNNSLFGGSFNLTGHTQSFPNIFSPTRSTTEQLTSPSKYAPVLQANVDKNQSLQPVSLSQLVKATQEHPDDAFQVNDTPLRNVTFVGYIVTVNELSTNLCYKIEDGSASMEVRLYTFENDSEYQAQKLAALQPGVWVRVFGTLREFNGERSVKAHHIQPVEDLNEILFHRLQVIQVYIHQTQRAKNIGSTEDVHMKSFSGMNQRTFAPEMSETGFTPIQQQILSTIRLLSKDFQGVSTQEIIANLQQKFDVNEIRQTIDILMNEGHIYSTIDEYHFQVCGGP
eukprot:jgi/Galph1/4200/GphlegSOOS_G2835.1